MSSIAIKIFSLAVRTFAKPIGTRIKTLARENEGFRKWSIARAQSLHRLDMRLRLGLLQDTAAIDRQIMREATEAAAKKKKDQIPTVKTEAQAKADEADTSKPKERVEEKLKPPKPRIRPLSEAKAIELGASFASESFIFLVGIGVLVFGEWLSKRSAASKRSALEDRIVELESVEKSSKQGLIELEKEILRLRAAKDGGAGKDHAKRHHILPEEIWKSEVEEEEEEVAPPGVWQRMGTWISAHQPLPFMSSSNGQPENARAEEK
ncbi:hypothetical protein MMC25_000213 [Agyrium rufum]|nr:hypothetical protein [Agyrium rufum]